MAEPQDIIPADEATSPLDVDDEAVGVDDDRSSLTSITDSILHGTLGEGKRTYAVYGKEEYGFPMDDKELDRIDACHVKYYALLNKRHYLAPISENPQRVLDLGCGTGIWCIDIADEHPETEVVGVDIAPTQPGWVPPNCRFELDDMERDWTWKEDTADFIFSRDLILSIRDFPRLIDQAYKHLKPGGWLEFHCVTGVLQCDDNTLPKDSYFQAFSDNLGAACTKFGTPVDDPTRWKGWFEQRGFEEVTEQVFKLPCNPWARDPRLKLVGAWEMNNLLNNLEGMTMRLFQKGLDWSEDEILVFNSRLRKDVKNFGMHTYWPFYTVYGRKPFHEKQ